MSNRSGVGSKVQIRAGSLEQRLEVSATTPAVAPADLIFGLGNRAGADAIRVVWPSGVVQAETAGATAAGSPVPVLPPPLAGIVTVEELNRKPSSCPFLYTWNGDRFQFVTDFLGGGEMGYWERPGTYNRPDPIEFVRIRQEQLREKDGRYDIRVTNELEETLFLDRLQLIAIDHPQEHLPSIPNEGMTDPPKPFRLFAVKDQRAPAAVTDGDGRDVTAKVAVVDRQYADGFELKSIRGYAAPHDLVIELGHVPPRPVLLLTGWTDYAFSSDNVAAHQAGLSLTPPGLDVRDPEGRWRPAIADIGIPVGRPQTIVVDLAPVLRAGEHTVRVTTNMRIYWDQISLASAIDGQALRSTWLDPLSALLRSRGFSQEVRPGGSEPPLYDYVSCHHGISVENGSWALHARRRREVAAFEKRRHVRHRETRRRNRRQLRRVGAAPAARRLVTHLPAQRRRVQQGNGRELREPGSCRAFAIPPDVRLSIRSVRAISGVGRTSAISRAIQHPSCGRAFPALHAPR